jgi:hypothetical protein
MRPGVVDWAGPGASIAGGRLAMTTTPTKVCIRCKRDCAGRPRTRDERGRYTCQECFDAVVAKAPLKIAPPPPPEPPEVDIGYLLAEEQAAAAPVAQDTATCMQCGVLMAPGAVLCTRCGHDTRTGAVVKAAPGKKRGPKRCEKCGYDVTGLKKPKCPECGTVFKLGRDLNQERKETSQQTVKWAYLKPLIMMGIGLALVMGLAVGQYGEGAAVLYLMKYAVGVPIGGAVFWVCCLMWIGFDAPFHLTLIRLAGIYAVVDAVALATGFLPVLIVGRVITLAVYIALLADLMDMDYTDAIFVGLATGLAKFFAMLLIIMYFFPDMYN